MNLKQHISETVKLAIPISAGQLGHVMLGVVDSLMVGKLGAVPLAAASLVNGLFFLIMVIGIGMTMAASPLIAMAKGRGKEKDCGKILNHSLLMNVTFSIVLISLMYGLSFLLPYMNQPEAVVKEALPYLRMLIASIIPFIIFQCYRQFLEGLSQPIPPMIIALSANILNAFLNWVFIFGNLGSPKLGLLGAGIATTGTRWTMAIALIIITLNYKRVQNFNPSFSLKIIDRALLKKLFSIGLPSGLQYFLEVGCFVFAAVMIGWIGAVPLAAHQIAINLASITYMIILGISSAGMIRVGLSVGSGKKDDVRKAGFTAMGLSGTLMITFGIIFIIMKDILPLFYINDIKVIELASQLIIVAALFQLFDGLQASGISVLRGLTDVKIPLAISFASYWLIGIPVAYILGITFKLGTVGIWIGLLIGLIVLGSSCVLRFNKKSKEEIILTEEERIALMG